MAANDSRITLDKVDVHIPPDYFVCDGCLPEMQDPAERRYRYPFINCTQCGPRYTLIDSLPYDRPNTAMAAFSLCPACLAEYRNPLDRRYHAQPLACSACGPQLMFRHSGRADINGNEAALAACLQGLREGAIIAVKGVGGYHLFCDASQTQVVARLREGKARPDKPLAVLLPWFGEQGLGWVEQLADLDHVEKQQLLSPQRPIVVVKKRANSGLSDAIAPGLSELGLMLPYSPLHHLASGAGCFGNPDQRLESVDGLLLQPQLEPGRARLGISCQPGGGDCRTGGVSSCNAGGGASGADGRRVSKPFIDRAGCGGLAAPRG